MVTLCEASGQDASRASAGAHAREAAQALAAVGVADRAGQCVGRIRAGAGVELQQARSYVGRAKPAQ